MKNILIVDDDMYIGDMVEEALKDEYEVTRAFSGTEAVLAVEKKRPDLVLLDLMLPGMTGEEVLEKIKDLPVIIMSAKTGTEDKVNLLMNGAVDYITKPFEVSELKARIAVQLRKSAAIAVDTGNILTQGEVSLDKDLLCVTVEGNEISLTRTETAILHLLMINCGRPLGRNTILDRIADETPDCTERSLKQHISNIRKKMQTVNGKDYIEAVYGIGFKFHL